MTDEFTTDERLDISRAFDSGNYAAAYEPWRIADLDDLTDDQRFAFVLGYYSGFALSEIGDGRDAFDEAYFSPVGRYVVDIAKYADSRADEYAAEGSS